MGALAVARLALVAAAATAVVDGNDRGLAPSIVELSGRWVSLSENVSSRAALGRDARALPVINNFLGAVGVAPSVVGAPGGERPVDLFAINALELPPFAGCGASAIGAGAPFGCGRMLVDGAQVLAQGTKWAAHEARRRSAPLHGSGVVVESATRMPFEQHGVMWQMSFTAPATTAATVKVDFELSAMVSRHSIGGWGWHADNAPSGFHTVSVSTNGTHRGATVCGVGSSGSLSRPACSRYQFAGAMQPDTVVVNPRANRSIPTARFSSLKIPKGQTVTLLITLALGVNANAATATGQRFGGTAPIFAAAWQAAHDAWEARWQQAFTPANAYWSGNLPTLEFGDTDTSGGGAPTPEAMYGAGVARVYYMSALTVVSQMRTNLPVFKRAFPNGNGNVFGTYGRGTTMAIGGTASWFWDESMASVLLSLLEPHGRAPTLQAWLRVNKMPNREFGYGPGNAYDTMNLTAKMFHQKPASGKYGFYSECLSHTVSSVCGRMNGRDRCFILCKMKMTPRLNFLCSIATA